MPFRAWFAFALFLVLNVTGQAANTRDPFLRGQAAKFPIIKLEKDQAPFAKVRTLSPPAEALEFEGRFYSGFRFTTPEWLDGDVIWMFAFPGAETENLKQFTWFVLPQHENGPDFKLGRSRWPGDHRFPQFQKQFPGHETFYLQYLQEKYLSPGKTYIVFFSFPERPRPDFHFSLTVRSDRGLGEYGILPTGYPYWGVRAAYLTPPAGKAKSPAKTAGEAVEIYRKSGNKAARDFLDKDLDAYMKTGGLYHDFYTGVWKSAQVGQGRVDREWAADCFGWLQEKSISLGAVRLAEGIVPNAFGSMTAANRYGAARQALAPFLFGMGRRKFSLDPMLLEDMGPGLPALPEVRMRKIPLTTIRPLTEIAYDGGITTTRDMPEKFSSSIASVASLEADGGSWKKALEQYLWASSWAEAKRGVKGEFEPEEGWFHARKGIARTLEMLGLLEAADAEHQVILAKDWPDIYQGRTLADSRHRRIAIKIALGGAEESMLAELDAMRAAFEKNPFFTRASWEQVEITKATCLHSLGRADEAEAILSKLVDSGNRRALNERIIHRLKVGKLEGLEAELVTVLADCRESGRKIEEAEIYSLYADFLEKTGRLDESLAMRREAIRLERGFDLFAKLPPEVARLAVTLARCGDEAGTKQAEEEAKALAANTKRLPERIARTVQSILATAPKSPATPAAKDQKILVELQPLRAIVVPVEGQPVRGRLTLANSSSQAVEGTLGFDGLPVNVDWDAASGEVRTSIGAKGGEDRVNKLRVEPGSYVQILLSAEAASPPKGELTVWWSSPGQDDRKSLWTFDTAEEGVSSAVIDAGEFKRNAFYGVPIHHHYQNASGKLATLRAVASVPARVEVYDTHDRPVYVDMNGNGNLAETGDSVFADGDSDGNADLALDSGEAVLRLQVFPTGELPKEGMKLTVEALVEGKWLPFSEDRIVP